MEKQAQTSERRHPGSADKRATTHSPKSHAYHTPRSSPASRRDLPSSPHRQPSLTTASLTARKLQGKQGRATSCSVFFGCKAKGPPHHMTSRSPFGQAERGYAPNPAKSFARSEKTNPV
eukprot:PhF_6_TR10965/c2_g1_i1/m.17685